MTSRCAVLATAACLAAGCRPPEGPGGGSRAPGGDLPPSGPLTLAEAGRFVLERVNRDRAEHGLPPVEWDDAAARAGARHAADMASRGFTAHWGTDGSVPEQRYTESGGVHFVMENAACFSDGETRALEPDPRFDPALLEKIQDAFLAEVPPADGHRRNILGPHHRKLGVGLARPVGVEQPCMAQEFVDEVGTYDPLPLTAAVGQRVTIAGEIRPPVELGGVGLSRIDPAAPRTPESLNRTGTYSIPEPFRVHFPPGFRGPSPPVKVQGNRFSIQLPLEEGGRRGRYGVSVWGKYPGSDALVMVSLRIVEVR